LFALALFIANLVWAAASTSIALHSQWYVDSFTFLSCSALAALGFQSLNNTHIAAVFNRVLCIIAAFGFGKFSYLQLRTNNHLSMSLSGTWVDATLMDWDKALGFDWWTYVNWLLANPTLLKITNVAYTRVDWPIGILAGILICLGQHKHLREFYGLTFLTSALCMWIAVGFPAQAAVASYGFSDVDTTFKSAPALYQIDKILALQGNGRVVLHPDKLPGLATFPSFHTALGILIAYSARSKIYLLVPAIVYSATMIAATPLFGGHYLIDIIAGALLPLAIIAVWRQLIEPKLHTLKNQEPIWMLVSRRKRGTELAGQ
jgi:membrane-associated phospholipid phosphatase